MWETINYAVMTISKLTNSPFIELTVATRMKLTNSMFRKPFNVITGLDYHLDK
mgnify:CR=1 FL=1